MNTKKKASRDAHELALAEMFYGEGAGTRRKLIQAAVQERINRDPKNYGQALVKAIEDEDMAENARLARKERKRIDRRQSVSKNTRALLTGNHQNLRSNILLLIIVGAAAHRSGLDKIALEKGRQAAEQGKVLYRQTLAKIQQKQRDRKRNYINPAN